MSKVRNVLSAHVCTVANIIVKYKPSCNAFWGNSFLESLVSPKKKVQSTAPIAERVLFAPPGRGGRVLLKMQEGPSSVAWGGIDLRYSWYHYTLGACDGHSETTVGAGDCSPVSRLLMRTSFWSAVRLPRAAGISPDEEHGMDTQRDRGVYDGQTERGE